MGYDNWKTRNPADDELGSALQRGDREPATCSKCSDEIDEDDGHLVECFETTGQLLCASCWEGVCEAEFRKGTTTAAPRGPGGAHDAS